jgi:hypothetical protein
MTTQLPDGEAAALTVRRWLEHPEGLPPDREIVLALAAVVVAMCRFLVERYGVETPPGSTGD